MVYGAFSLGCNAKPSGAPASADTGEPGSGCAEVRYLDADGDGYASEAYEPADCPPPAMTTAPDCQDEDAGINPGAAEVCDGEDQDCDGEADEGAGSAWYADIDGDSYGDPGAGLLACEQPDAHVADASDCDDADGEVRPGVWDGCDGVDNDCDGAVDEDGSDWFPDADGDGYGDAGAAGDCASGEGRASNNGDCDDGNGAVLPGMNDRCDGADNDCDGAVDEDYRSDWMLLTVHKDGTTYQINRTTAALTKLSSHGTSHNTSSTAVREDGTLIAFTNDDRTLRELEPCTGAFTEIGPTGGGEMGGISFGDADTVLYGLDKTADELVTLSLLDGSASTVGPLGVAIGNDGLAYDCSADVLYGVDADSQRLFQLDRSTGLASGFVPLSISITVVGLEYDNVAGVLLLSTGSSLYEIEPATGIATFVGSFGKSEINDLVYYPPCE